MIVRTRPPSIQLPREWKLSNLLARLGDVDPERIRLHPWPGLATDEDCSESKDRFGCLCEMVEGVLVEKIMGWEEARLASALAHLIEVYLERHPLGIVFGPDGPVRVELRVIRMPDVSFVSWDQLPDNEQEMPAGPIMELVPDLAVEVISQSNRPGEMEVKLQEYFEAGVKLVWYIYPKDRTAKLFTALDRFTEIEVDGILDAREVLPGFRLKLRTLFDRAFPKRPKKKRGK